LQSTTYFLRGEIIRIAHLSDLHITDKGEFKKEIFEKGKEAVNSIDPKADFIFITGDITFEGLIPEYELASERIKEFESETTLIPGNHDARHLGFHLFEEFFKRLEFFKKIGDIGLMGLDSSEPDRDEGHIGRGKYPLIEKNLMDTKEFKIIGLHHHIVPVPNSGREQNIINDAGGLLDLVLRNDVPLILMGHRHVPYSVRVHNTLFVNAGTFSSQRTRAHFGNSFNIIDITKGSITVAIFEIESGEQKVTVNFDRDNNIYQNRHYSP
jgi:3',5'-cyclic AMP phosphodiesterase CpdA